MIGTQIGSYLIQDKLGEGGMGTVYRALETSLDRIVAIKVLKADIAQDAAIADRFRSEARAQANLNHTNIATLYTFLIHDGNPVMVMEYVDGESFQQIVRRRGPVPPNEAVPLFRQALLGVGAAHRMGIIHRDIKPANLMLGRSGIVKVMDFGIAKITSNTHGPTRTGTQMGTLFYMSPEQVKGERVDIRSDIYALGVTLYEIITGNVPFSSDSEFQILNDHVNTPPPPPSRFHPYLPKGLENIILKSLAKSPADRFATVEEFGAALEHMDAWESSPLTSSASLNATIVEGMADKSRTGGTAPFAQASTPPFSATVLESSTGQRFASAPPAQAAQSLPVIQQNSTVETASPAQPLPRKALAAAAVVLCLASGGAYLYSHSKPSTASVVRTDPGANAPSSTPFSSSSSGEPATPVSPNTGPVDSSLAPALNSGLANDLIKKSNGGTRVPNQPASGSAGNSDNPRIATNTRSSSPSQPPPASPTPAPATSTPPQTPPPTTQQAPKPTASSAEIDEARSRFIRLRSKALALKNSLGELRQRLASQGMSVNNDALEAEGNMDSYMQEADRALQSGDASAAQTNLDRAEHETKKLAAVFGR